MKNTVLLRPQFSKSNKKRFVVTELNGASADSSAVMCWENAALWITCCGEWQSVCYNHPINKAPPQFPDCRHFFLHQSHSICEFRYPPPALQKLQLQSLQWPSPLRFLLLTPASSPPSHCWEAPMSGLKLRRRRPTCTRSALSLPFPALLSLSKLSEQSSLCVYMRLNVMLLRVCGLACLIMRGCASRCSRCVCSCEVIELSIFTILVPHVYDFFIYGFKT